MKNAVLFLLALFLFSCTPDSDNTTTTPSCGTEIATAMAIDNSSDWDTYPRTTTYSFYDVDYYDGVAPGISGFAIGTTLYHACTHEQAVIVAEHELHVANPFIRDTVLIRQGGGTSVRYEAEQDLSGLFHFQTYFTFPNSSIGDDSLTYVLWSFIPDQGSWEADSAYFFGNTSRFVLNCAAYRAP